MIVDDRFHWQWASMLDKYCLFNCSFAWVCAEEIPCDEETYEHGVSRTEDMKYVISNSVKNHLNTNNKLEQSEKKEWPPHNKYISRENKYNKT